MFQHYSLIALAIGAVLLVLYLLVGKYRLSWFGKIVGFILGYTLAQAPGALMGVLIGHIFDSVSIGRVRPKTSNAQPKARPVERTPEEIFVDDQIYFDTLFSVLGTFAAQGEKVATPDLNELHNIMRKMHLDENDQRSAWDWFRHGQHNDFNLRQALFGFARHGGAQSEYSQEFLQTLVQFAIMRKPLNQAQYTILTTVAHALGLPTTSFAHLAPKQQHSQGKKEYTETKQASTLDDAYKMLSMKSSASNAEIKWAYRKLMSRYHPDRLMSKDLPDEFIQLATRRTQEIKNAYEKILDSRGLKK
jgi:DnaJ like chaperone protein